MIGALGGAERRVLECGLEGPAKYPAIARRLGLSPWTVRTQARSAMRKLGASTFTHAVAIYLTRLRRVARGEPAA